jgi:hypothetical protein
MIHPNSIHYHMKGYLYRVILVRSGSMKALISLLPFPGLNPISRCPALVLIYGYVQRSRTHAVAPEGGPRCVCCRRDWLHPSYLGRTRPDVVHVVLTLLRVRHLMSPGIGGWNRCNVSLSASPCACREFIIHTLQVLIRTDG